MKTVDDMTIDELIEEHKSVNRRIAKDPRQTYIQRKIAQQKVKLAKLMGNDYMEAVKKLYKS